MKIIKWEKENNTNIELIDEQHHKLINLLNEIAMSYKNNKRHNMETEKILDELDNYITLHFQLEENYAKKYGFPGYNELVAEHDIFRKMYSSFRYYYSAHSGSTHFSKTMIKYLDILIVEWLHAHITGIDKEFANFIKDKNIEIA